MNGIGIVLSVREVNRTRPKLQKGNLVCPKNLIRKELKFIFCTVIFHTLYLDFTVPSGFITTCKWEGGTELVAQLTTR